MLHIDSPVFFSFSLSLFSSLYFSLLSLKFCFQSFPLVLCVTTLVFLRFPLPRVLSFYFRFPSFFSLFYLPLSLTLFFLYFACLLYFVFCLNSVFLLSFTYPHLSLLLLSVSFSISHNLPTGSCSHTALQRQSCSCCLSGIKLFIAKVTATQVQIIFTLNEHVIPLFFPLTVHHHPVYKQSTSPLRPRLHERTGCWEK